MSNKAIGFIVIIWKGESEQYEALGYGHEGDPWKDELLRDRGATLFETSDEAGSAIKAIHASGAVWVKEWRIGVLPVFKPQIANSVTDKD